MNGTGRTAADALRVRRVTGLDGLASLRAEWRTLHPDCRVYARHEWHSAVAHHFVTDEAALAWLQVLDGDRTVAVLPTIADRESLRGFGSRRVLGAGRHRLLNLIDAPMAADADPAAVACALDRALARQGDWFALRWPRIQSSGHLAALAHAWPGGRMRIAEGASGCNWILLAASADATRRGLPRSLAQNLRTAANRLARAGTAQWTDESTPEAFEAFLALEASGWKGASGTGSAIGLLPGGRTFFGALLAAGDDDWRPSLLMLRQDGRPIAGALTVRTGLTRHVLKIAYDESAAFFSPGQQLMWRLMATDADAGVTRVDMMSDTAWQNAWHPVREPTLNVTLYRHRAAAAWHDGLRLAKRVVQRARSAAPGGEHVGEPTAAPGTEAGPERVGARAGGPGGSPS